MQVYEDDSSLQTSIKRHKRDENYPSQMAGKINLKRSKLIKEKKDHAKKQNGDLREIKEAV